jgi:hypothetical protein
VTCEFFGAECNLTDKMSGCKLKSGLFDCDYLSGCRVNTDLLYKWVPVPSEVARPVNQLRVYRSDFSLGVL